MAELNHYEKLVDMLRRPTMYKDIPMLSEIADDIEGLLAACDNYSDALKDTVDELEGKDKVLKQVYWERDTALHQLAEIGKGLGEKMDDVVPVKHGKWILEEDWSTAEIEDGEKFWVCSLCGCGSDSYDTTYHTNFCPKCGARMETEGEE